jgi:hypothetical protein
VFKKRRLLAKFDCVMVMDEPSTFCHLFVAAGVDTKPVKKACSSIKNPSVNEHDKGKIRVLKFLKKIIRKHNKYGYQGMMTREIACLPRNFILYFGSTGLSESWEKFPTFFADDKSIIKLKKETTRNCRGDQVDNDTTFLPFRSPCRRSFHHTINNLQCNYFRSFEGMTLKLQYPSRTLWQDLADVGNLHTS